MQKIQHMKIKNLLIPVIILIAISCKKKSGTTPPPMQQDVYLTTTAGSTWSYHQVDSSGATPVNSDYTLTSTARDTTINSKSYHIYTNSGGGSQYLNLTGDNYYQFDSLPAGFGATAFENLYLKNNVDAGTQWTQNLSVTVSGVPLAIPLTITYTIAEKGISKTVNNQPYTNVIHVTASISSSLIPPSALTSSINMYYAPKYGMIASSTIINLNYSGVVKYANITSLLTNATLL